VVIKYVFESSQQTVPPSSRSLKSSCKDFRPPTAWRVLLLDLAAKLRTQHPTLPILLATGYSAAAARGEGSEFPILPKPYKRDKLSAMLSQAMSDFSQAA